VQTLLSICFNCCQQSLFPRQTYLQRRIDDVSEIKQIPLRIAGVVPLAAAALHFNSVENLAAVLSCCGAQ
jgi:hypothetical protein